MFKTDINHFLQSFDSPLLYQFLKYISFLGTVYMLILLVLVLIGGINFRKGILVLNILGWSSLVIVGAKQFFDYPRPIAVDPTLESFGSPKTDQDLTDLQPTGFFDEFSSELLTITRSSDIGRYGFPSGHVAIITAIWLGIALLFKRKGLWWLTAFLIVSTAISRMYLGVHYLGDVIGGLVLGAFLALLFNLIFTKVSLIKESPLGKPQMAFFLAPLLLILLFKVVPAFQAGGLIGFNLAAIFIYAKWGEVKLADGVWKKAANVLIISVLYFAGFFLLRTLPLGKYGILPMLINSIAYTAILILGFLVGKSSKLYQKE